MSGVSRGDKLADIAARLAPLHPRNDTFSGEVLPELAADRDRTVRRQPPGRNRVRRYPRTLSPEAPAHTKAQHHKSKFALRAAAMLRASVDPGLLDEVGWWKTDDLWYWSLEALVTDLRAVADRTGMSIDVICRRVAERHHVTLDE